MLVIALFSSDTIARDPEPWPTRHFEVVVARVGNDSDYDPRRYYEALMRGLSGTEPQIDAGPGSEYLTFEQKVELEDYLNRAANQLIRWGFDPPLLQVHEPLIPRRAGVDRVYRLYLMNFNEAFEGEHHDVNGMYLAPCPDEVRKSIIKLNLKNFTFIPLLDPETGLPFPGLENNREVIDLGDMKRIAGHELFHAVQGGAAYRDVLCPSNPWFSEGSAEAIEWDLYETLEKDTYGNRGNWGRRSYENSLEKPLKRSPTSYDTASFWRYLAELDGIRQPSAVRKTDVKKEPYYLNKPGPISEPVSYRYLANQFRQKPVGGEGEMDALRELRWVQESARNYFKIPMNRILADFYSVYLGYGKYRNIFKSFESDWVTTACGVGADDGVQEYVLPGRSRTVSMQLSVDNRAMTCFALRPDITLTRPFEIHISVSIPGNRVVNHLHIGEANGQRIGHALTRPPRCKGTEPCIISYRWPITTNGPVVFALINAAPNIWEGQDESAVNITVSSAGRRDNLGTIPKAVPTSGKGRAEPKPGPKGALDAAEQVTEEGMQSINEDSIGSAELTRDPDRCQEPGNLGNCEPEMKITLSLVPGMGYESLFGTIHTSGGLIQQSMAGAQLMGELYGEVMEAERRYDELMEGRDGAGITITFPLIDYGFEGTIDNALIDVTRAGGGNYATVGPADIDPDVVLTRFPPSGSVTIEEYTPYMLRGSFAGQLVRFRTREERLRDQQRGVRKPVLPVVKPVSGRFWVSNPYYGDADYEEIIPDEMIEAMEQEVEGMIPFAMPMEVGPGGPGGSPGAQTTGPQGNPFGGECSCTCEELEKITNMGESMEAMDDGGMPDPALMSLMMCPMMCLSQYDSCEVE